MASPSLPFRNRFVIQPSASVSLQLCHHSFGLDLGRDNYVRMVAANVKGMKNPILV
jgi:hypothetical protein